MLQTLHEHAAHNPIIVGGMGGSGTRVVAKILEASGVYLGRFLNPQFDNLLFPLFGYAERFRRTPEELAPFIALFETMHLNRRLTLRQWIRLLAPLLNTYKRRTHFKRVRYAFAINRRHEEYLRWRWKHPQNQFFLQQLNAYSPKCFYIHVVRHGLDMAFSKNLRQLEQYGAYFGISQNQSDVPAPVHQLELWIKTNKWVQEYCTAHMPARHYVLRFDELCLAPEKIITELLGSLNLKSQVSVSELVKLVETPPTRNRYLFHDLSLFSPDHIAAVQQFGFSIQQK